MKKFWIVIIILVLIGGGFFVRKIILDKKEEAKIEEIKKGWYVEILNDYLNIRVDHNRNSTADGKVLKGEVYEVLSVNLDDSNNYWYEIQLDEKTGWIANNKNGTYLKDVNNPNDVATPSIRYENSEYSVYSIDDISYDHLILWDDKEGYKVTHQVYHEVNEENGIDQYWIKYTITDAAGKSDSKTQKIIFVEKPAESEVLDFDKYYTK